MQEVIIFEVGTSQFGIKAGLVGEIIRAVEVTPLPEIPFPFVGVINYRGKTIPVIRFQQFLSAAPTSPTIQEQMVILNLKDEARICLLVDRVTSFARPDSLQPLSELTTERFQAGLPQKWENLVRALSRL